VKWHVSLAPADAKVGDEVEIVFDADIASGWILYSSDFKLELGPLPAKFTFDANTGVTPMGEIQPVKPQWKTDKTLEGKYSYFARHAQFRQKARLVAARGSASGRITGQTCFEESGLCQLFRETFSTKP
jgi:thiol:disulfide interchange protein DsbD